MDYVSTSLFIAYVQTTVKITMQDFQCRFSWFKSGPVNYFKKSICNVKENDAFYGMFLKNIHAFIHHFFLEAGFSNF